MSRVSFCLCALFFFKTLIVVIKLFSIKGNFVDNFFFVFFKSFLVIRASGRFIGNRLIFKLLEVIQKISSTISADFFHIIAWVFSVIFLVLCTATWNGLFGCSYRIWYFAETGMVSRFHNFNLSFVLWKSFLFGYRMCFVISALFFVCTALSVLSSSLL